MSKSYYTTQLQAGLGLVNETQLLLGIWQQGMSTTDLFQTALDSGEFPNVTARRLRNIIAERVLGLPQEPRADKGKAFKDVPSGTVNS